MLLLLVDVIHRRERRMGDITVHIDVHIVVHIGGDRGVIIHRAIAKGIVSLVMLLLHLMLLLLHHKGRLVATLVIVVEEAIMISLVVSIRNIIGFGMIYLDGETQKE